MLECAPGSFGAPVSPEAGAVRRLPAASRLSLRIKDDGVGPPGAVARLSLDQPINRVSATDGRFAARLGPDEWLIIAAPSEADDLRSSITEALADRFHALSTSTPGIFQPAPLRGPFSGNARSFCFA
jgi:sarcosine oxidase subunit gamma